MKKFTNGIIGMILLTLLAGCGQSSTAEPTATPVAAVPKISSAAKR
jgi:hypothetical protein